MLTLYLFVSLSIILAALLIRRYDLYDREPWFMLILTGLGAAIVMWVLGYIEDMTLDALFGVNPSAFQLSLVASTHEELGRFFIVLSIIMLFEKYFNDPIDGLIYGSVAGLGMAAYESFSHWDRITSPNNYELFAREATRLYLHSIFGGIAAFGLGPWHIRLKSWGWMILGTLILAIGLHLSWDWISLSQSFHQERETILIVASIAIVVVGTFAYGFLTAVASEWSRQHFGAHPVGFFFSWPLKLFKK